MGIYWNSSTWLLADMLKNSRLFLMTVYGINLFNAPFLIIRHKVTTFTREALKTTQMVRTSTK